MTNTTKMAFGIPILNPTEGIDYPMSQPILIVKPLTPDMSRRLVYLNWISKPLTRHDSELLRDFVAKAEGKR